MAIHNIKTVGGFFRALNLKLSITSQTLASSSLEKTHELKVFLKKG